MNEKETALFEVLLAQSAELHKHLCPRQVLGVRMGLFAGKLHQFVKSGQSADCRFVF